MTTGPGRRVAAAAAVLLLGVGATACADEDPADGASGDCSIALSQEGERYGFHGAVNPPDLERWLGDPAGEADEVGCRSDPTVLGTVAVRTVAGVSPDDVLVVVREEEGRRSVEAYLNESLPRDRAPAGWPVPIPAEAWE